MLKEGRKILVHIYDCTNREISTRNFGKVFEVKKENEKLGIEWEENNFSSFSTFASNVIFEDVETREKYHYSAVVNRIVAGC